MGKTAACQLHQHRCALPRDTLRDTLRGVTVPGARNGGLSTTSTAVSGPLAGLVSVRSGCLVWTSHTRADPSTLPA